LEEVVKAFKDNKDGAAWDDMKLMKMMNITP
jgi:hypothetical protein